MEFVYMVVRFFEAGGPFMFPILVVAASGPRSPSSGTSR